MKTFPLPALLLLALTASCAKPGGETSQAARVLVRMAVETSRDHPTAMAARELSRLADRASGSRILVRIYEDGALGDDFEVLEQLRFGGIDLAVVSISAFETIPGIASRLSAPETFPTPESIRDAFAGEPGKDLAEDLAAERLLLLSWYDGGPECYLLPYSKTRFDIRNLRIGVGRSTSLMEEVSSSGGVPVPLSTTELRRSIESDFVEGIRAPLALVLANRLETDRRVFPLSGSRVPEVIVGSRTSLMQIPESDRAILFQAALDSRIFQADAMAFMEQRFTRDSAHDVTKQSGGNP